MERKNIFGILGLALVGILLSAVFVSAYRGDPTQTGPYYNPEKHEEMMNAFENMDYETWVELMTRDGKSPRILEVVNEDNFDLFIEMRNAMIADDINRANELRMELGLGQGMMKQQGKGFGGGKGMRGQGGGPGNCPYMN